MLAVSDDETRFTLTHHFRQLICDTLFQKRTFGKHLYINEGLNLLASKIKLNYKKRR